MSKNRHSDLSLLFLSQVSILVSIINMVYTNLYIGTNFKSCPIYWNYQSLLMYHHNTIFLLPWNVKVCHNIFGKWTVLQTTYYKGPAISALCTITECSPAAAAEVVTQLKLLLSYFDVCCPHAIIVL